MKEWYGNLNGLRVVSCLCIIAMHIRANADYVLGSGFDKIVASWTHFVMLFLMISGFGMFCGYYDKFRNSTISINDFYAKRYKKILPFFVVLVLLDVVIDRSLAHVIEGITEITLVFGLLPNNQPDVIGVSWTLGVIFLFYMLFPFVVFLCWTKRRAWISFAVSIIICLFCVIYYFTEKFVLADFSERHNFLYCAPFFLGGGIIYLNREAISGFVKRFRWIFLLICIALSVAWYFVYGETEHAVVLMTKNLILFFAWLIYAISVESKILDNKVMKYLSGISLELYLGQMVMFRVIEKLHFLYLVGNGRISFILVWIIVVAGLIVFIEVWKRAWSFAQKKLMSFSSND